MINANYQLSYIGSMQHDNYNGMLPMVDLGKQVTAFSDSIVISYDTSMPGGGFHVLMDLVYICNDLLGIGIPVRGGVTVGQLIHDERKCFGPAMVEAYLMESQAAIYPRIIINLNVYANNENLRSKYEWLRWYYNETITAVYKQTEQLLI